MNTFFFLLIHNLFSCNAVTDISYRIFYVWTLTRKQKSFSNRKKKENCEKLLPEFLFFILFFSHLHFQGGKTIIYITLFLLFLISFGENITSHKLKASPDKKKGKLETKKKRELKGKWKKSVFLSFSFMFGEKLMLVVLVCARSLFYKILLILLLQLYASSSVFWTLEVIFYKKKV